MGKKVLIVTVSAPPCGGSHATRISAIVEGFNSNGVNVALITCQSSAAVCDNSILYKRLKEMSVIIQTSGGVVRAAASSVGNVSNAELNLEKYIQKIRAYVRRKMIPDTYISWVPGAVRAGLNCIKESEVEIIVSSGAPFSAHIAAFIISKISGVPLALDYGDPWVYEPGRPRRGLRLLFERSLERLILNNSIITSFTTGPTIQLYNNTYAKINTCYYMLPMGFNKDEYIEHSNRREDKSRKLSFVYAGRINEEYRSLDSLILLLDYEVGNNKNNINNNQVEFVFYGNELGGVRKQLDYYARLGLVRFEHNLDHKEYIETISESDGLVVFGNNSPIQIPGKIPHFLAARRPILYLRNMEKSEYDPSYHLLINIQLSHLYCGDSVNEYVSFKSACDIGAVPDINEVELNGLEWSNICNKYVSVLAGLIEKRNA
jgi:hypothetical protein